MRTGRTLIRDLYRQLSTGNFLKQKVYRWGKKIEREISSEQYQILPEKDGTRHTPLLKWNLGKFCPGRATLTNATLRLYFFKFPLLLTVLEL